MIRFERTFDAELVRAAIANPRTYRQHCCDGSPHITQFRPNMDESIQYVKVSSGDDYLGVFMFVPLNPICWEIHTCLLPSAWGPIAKEAGNAICPWIFANTPCVSVVTHIPEDNVLAHRFALDCGMTVRGLIPCSFQREGRIMGQYVLSINKGGL